MGRMSDCSVLWACPKLFLYSSCSNQVWGRRGRVEIISLNREVLLFKFEIQQTLNWVVEEGPWFTDRKSLLLKRWKSGMVVEKFSTDVFHVRVKLRKVPLELFTSGVKVLIE